MNAAEVRGRADSFDPMKAARWTMWQALAWVVHHDVDKVLECSEIWKQKGPSSPVEGAELGPFRRIWEEMHNNPGPNESWAEAEMRPNPVRDGWHKLQLALESGRVTSSGIDVATGKKREISELEWDDLRFADPVIIKPCDPIILESSGYEYLCADGPQCYWEDAEFWRRPEPAFREVRVRRADVLKEFPAKPTQQALEKHPGGAPVKYDWAGGEDRLAQVCEQCGGIPSRSHTAPDWRTKADAYRVVREYLDLDGDGGPSDTVLKERVGPMLDRIDRRMKKVGN
jgi:hypothetical protein